MKKNSLTTAVVAGIAGVAGFAGLANAVELNPDGLGQVLIYPYYTVNKSQDSLFSVVNTTGVGKAVKVRFLEGYNSREVLDFNLFLSPNDVWTMRAPGFNRVRIAFTNTRSVGDTRSVLFSMITFANSTCSVNNPTMLRRSSASSVIWRSCTVSALPKSFRKL